MQDSYIQYTTGVNFPKVDSEVIYSAGTDLYDTIASAVHKSETNISRVLFVDPNGNDLTGSKGNISKPYQTIEAAWSAATTGDTIHVFPGDYTVTTNLAKDAVTYYFEEGAIVRKSASGDIFNYDNSAIYVNDINILGYGRFYKTTTSDAVFRMGGNTSLDVENINIEFDIISSTNGMGIDAVAPTSGEIKLNIKGNYVISSGSWAINASSYNGSVYINVSYIISTANIALVVNQRQGISNVISTLVKSTANDGIYVAGVGATFNFNVAYSYGTTYGYYLYGNSSLCWVSINGNTVGIYNTGYITTTQNGNCVTLYNGFNNDPIYVGNSCGYVTCKGGRVKCDIQNQYYSTVTVTGGVVDVNYINNGLFATYDQYNLVLTGGITYVNGDISSLRGYYPFIDISGSAKVIINAHIKTTGTGSASNTYGTLVYQHGASSIVDIRGNLYNLLPITSTSTSNLIYKTSGKTIFNGATLVKDEPNGTFILCPSPSQDVMVYSGGVNTNGNPGDLLSAKAQKHIFYVNADVEPTTLVLSGETFTSTITGSTNIIATDLVDQITTGTTILLTATDNLDGSFNVEADVPGDPFTVAGLVNLTGIQLRLNGYAITDLINGTGTIVEYSGVTY